MEIDIRIKSSTIVETLVASVIIVVIFSIASLTLNNVFKTSILSDTSGLENHVDKIIYMSKNNKLELPYYKSFEGWELTCTKQQGGVMVKAKKDLGKGRIKEFNKEISTNAY